MPLTFDEIDRLIGAMLMPKTRALTKHGRARCGRCQCGHIDLVHLVTRQVTSTPGACPPIYHDGACLSRRCQCRRFVPYAYDRERQAMVKRFRAFAFALLDADRKTTQ
jgi:hypothetical protein